MTTGAKPPINVRDLSAAFDDADRQARQDLGKINVLVGGLAGVGKSTLINVVFGSNVAITGVGLSQTQRIEAHEAPDSPLRIYDTPGFEIANAAGSVAAVRDCIAKLRASTDPDGQIHIAWTCILEQSHRIEPVHRSLLSMLGSMHIPSVVVITQALGEKEMENKVRELAVPHDCVLPVLAVAKTIGGYTVPTSGVGELVGASIRLLPEARRAAFVAAQKARWDLKEAAVMGIINKNTAIAAGTSLIPIPGGHSVALIAVQVKLIAQINAALGLSLTEIGGKNLVQGFFGIILAKAGGAAAFSMTLSEAMKFFPGLGWFGAAMIGGPIGGAVTKSFGHLYFNSIAPYAKRGEPLPSPEQLARQMEEAFEKNRSQYETLASEQV
jgi:uncharacterized protein (DUF697 family)/predicted GTPase